MSDDLDDELRAAMKVLDGEAPSGYFDGLPERTLARLEETEAMQTSGMDPTRMSDNESGGGVPPLADANRDEDSGLHDIRSLASSTKLRMSRRVASVPPPMDEDILATSSAGWKAVALPEPAKMVSLPELSQLAPAAEVKAKDKAARKAAKAAPDSAGARDAAVVAAAAAPATSVPSQPSASTPMIGARFAARPKATGSKSTLYATIGIGVAVAAGGLVVWKLKGGAPAATQVASAPEAAKAEVAPPAVVTPPVVPVPAPTATPIETAAVAAPPPVDPTAVASDASADDRHHGDSKATKRPAVAAAGAVATADAKPEKAGAKPVKPTAAAPGGAAGGDADPSFDALLKEAGVDANKPKTVVLEKKSLSSGDIRTGMSAVAGKAQGCYAGQQGTASVKLTVAASGKVSKATVSGAFAGTPVAACVESAVKSAQFPAWDGGPQTVSYSYLLAE